MVLKSFLGFVLLVLSLLSQCLERCVGHISGEGNCLKKMFKKIHMWLHFKNTNNPILRALIMTNFTNRGQYWIIWIKRFWQFPFLNDLPQMNTFVQQMPQFTLKYTWRVFSLGRYTTLFQAEIYAIVACAHEMQSKCKLDKQVSICSDSQAALKVLQAVRTMYPLVRQC